MNALDISLDCDVGCFCTANHDVKVPFEGVIWSIDQLHFHEKIDPEMPEFDLTAQIIV